MGSAEARPRPSPNRRLAWRRQRGYVLLLAFLVFEIFLQPLIRSAHKGTAELRDLLLDRVLFAGVLLGAVYAVTRRVRNILIWGACAIAIVVLTSLPGELGHALHTWGILATVLFLAAVVYRLSGAIFGHPTVTSETINGALCLYLLIGLIWGLLYALVLHGDPGAFRGVAPFTSAGDAVSRSRTTSDLMYFSFVTLSTLGYGDITPSAGPVRLLAALEAITGQVFLAVTVGRLVGMQIAARDGSPREMPPGEGADQPAS